VVERAAVNRLVAGSSPAAGAILCAKHSYTEQRVQAGHTPTYGQKAKFADMESDDSVAGLGEYDQANGEYWRALTCLVGAGKSSHQAEPMIVDIPPPDLEATPSDPIQSAFMTGVQLLESGRASLLLRDVSEPVLVVTASVGIDSSVISSIRVPIGQGVAGIVAERGISLYGALNGSTFLCAPIVTDRGIEGVLNLTDRRGGKQYTTEHVAAASSVAAHIARLLEFGRNASKDTVSGLPNRRAFESALDREMARSKRTGNPFAIVFIDLDNLKEVNDRFGHTKGDEVIKNVGDALQRVLRPYDFAGRYGGDEFALLLGAPSDSESGIAWRISEAVAEIASQLQVGITISVGVAHCPIDGINANQLVAKADSRMYDNKRMKKSLSSESS
jgi:diguanylate cyclase (GGDEF)-like protein